MSAAAAQSGACSSTPTDRADIVVSVDSSSSAQTNFFLVCGTLRFFSLLGMVIVYIQL